jgi:predicted transposase YbfD/YdcC
MVAQVRPLCAVFAAIPDVRKKRGKRHSLAAILALVGVAVLCGARSYGAIAQWARIYPPDLVRALGFTHPTPPCAATLCTVLRQIDREVVEATLGAWAEDVLASLPPRADEAVALDGKTLRGSRQQGALRVHLLSAVSHRLGLTLGQQAVGDKTNEITMVVPLLRSLVVEGRIFTMDALLTQRAIAQTIVEGGGDYVMIVKGNQPQLQQDTALVFADPPEGEVQLTAQAVERGHGRVAYRRLTGSDALVGYNDWPGLRQVFRLDRLTLVRATGEVRVETVYGVTSLARARGSAERLLSLTRHHWQIENRSHWVRDVTFDEDRSQVRRGSTPQVMAAVRNTVIGLLRVVGETNIAAACRRLAAQPAAALGLIGIESDN